MTTKEKIRNGIAKIAKESQYPKTDIVEFVGDEFRKSITKEDKKQDTIKKITKETLDGINEGIRDVQNNGKKYADKLIGKGVEIREVLTKSAEAMINAAKAEGEEALAINMKAAEKVQDYFEKELIKVNYSLDIITDKAKEQMEIALINLNKTKEEVRSMFESISHTFKHYPNDNKKDTSNPISDTLQETANKSNDTLADLMNIALNHSKRITHHSLSKVSEWLKNLSNKINS